MRRLLTGMAARLALFAAVLVAATAAAVAGFLVEQQSNHTVRDLTLRSGAVARGIAAQVAGPLEMGDRAQVERAVDRLDTEKDVARVEISDFTGRRVVERDFQARIEGADPVVVPVVGPPDADGFRTPIGQVRVHLSAPALAARRAELAGGALRVTVTVALVGLAIAALLAIALAAPLGRLRTGVERLADGAYADAEQVPIAGPHELRALGAAFREAAAAVAEREAELRAVNAALRRTEEMRDAMTHMLVHDLKGPLSNLIMLLGLLETAELDEEDRELLTEGKARCQGLMQMIADLLMVARLESGKVELELEQFAVDDLVDGALRTIEVLAAQSGFRVEVASPEDDAAQVVADRRLLERVLQNLLTNALHYGQSPIRLDARVEGEALVLVVEDAGEGIPPAQVERVFEMFGTLDRGKGTGLGLAFVRLAVEAHDGAIAVDGARFTLTVPRRGPAALAEAA